jgi:hypothetical protein
MLRALGLFCLLVGGGFIIGEVLSLMDVLPTKGGLFADIFGQPNGSIVAFGLGAILLLTGYTART